MALAQARFFCAAGRRFTTTVPMPPPPPRARVCAADHKTRRRIARRKAQGARRCGLVFPQPAQTVVGEQQNAPTAVE
jgi:hypothetical protein